MNTNELMRGDIVRISYGGKFTNATVAEIYQHSIFTEDGEWEGMEVSETDIEPIPLTKEILERNRFQAFAVDNFSEAHNCIGKWWSKGGDIFVKEYVLGHGAFGIRQTVFTLGWHPHSRVCNIRYVHELQHAMRMSGAKREIKL